MTRVTLLVCLLVAGFCLPAWGRPPVGNAATGLSQLPQPPGELALTLPVRTGYGWSEVGFQLSFPELHPVLVPRLRGGFDWLFYATAASRPAFQGENPVLVGCSSSAGVEIVLTPRLGVSMDLGLRLWHASEPQRSATVAQTSLALEGVAGLVLHL